MTDQAIVNDTLVALQGIYEKATKLGIIKHLDEKNPFEEGKSNTSGLLEINEKASYLEKNIHEEK